MVIKIIKSFCSSWYIASALRTLNGPPSVLAASQKTLQSACQPAITALTVGAARTSKVLLQNARNPVLLVSIHDIQGVKISIITLGSCSNSGNRQSLPPRHDPLVWQGSIHCHCAATRMSAGLCEKHCPAPSIGQMPHLL